MDLEKEDLETPISEKTKDEADRPSDPISLDEHRSKQEQLSAQLQFKDLRIGQLEKQLKEWEQKIGDIRDYVKKLEVEVGAVRERSQKELDSRVEQRTANFLNQFLNIQDNLKRSLESAETSNNIESLTEGLQLILKQMGDILKDNQLQVIPAVGELFDPNVHEAISTQAVDRDDQDDRILFEVRTGYRLKDLVVRPSQVIVGKKM